MIFVDASALVAILAKEANASDLFSRLEASSTRFYSAISRWETVAALCKSHGYAPAAASLVVDDFFQTFDFEIVSIGRREAELAGAAYERYGRGRHPAALNMGDCFAYACATSCGATLLYQGNDFGQTDLA